MTPEHVKIMLSKRPMNRFVEADEIAAMVLDVFRTNARFPTGAVFDISGGARRLPDNHHKGDHVQAIAVADWRSHRRHRHRLEASKLRHRHGGVPRAFGCRHPGLRVQQSAPCRHDAVLVGEDCGCSCGAPPAETAFDLKLGGFSWMDYIASHGYDVYLLDVRGYSKSTRPPSRWTACQPEPALRRHRGSHAHVDAVVVEFVKKRRGIDKVNLLGWSWGTAIMQWYASPQQPQGREGGAVHRCGSAPLPAGAGRPGPMPPPTAPST